MKNGKIGVTTENIFPVIKKFLYSDHEIFLRELISNAVDATQKLKTLSSMGEAKGELGDLAIRVAADKERKTLTVTDRGVGMTAEEVDRYINQIAFSGAEEFMAKYKDQAIIGHFGLGFYSAFMVSDKVEIVTRSWKEGARTVRWSCTGTPEFEMEVHAADSGQRPRVVAAGVAADVGHQDAHPFALEGEKFAVGASHDTSVDIAIDGPQGFERRDLVGDLRRADVPGVPDFVHVLEECFERLVERAVGVGYESYAFHAILLFSVFFGKLPAKFVFHSDSCLPNLRRPPSR